MSTGNQFIAEIKAELTSIIGGLNQLKGKIKSYDELNPFQDRLRIIDSKQTDGKFVDANGEIPPGQAELHELIDQAYDLKEEIGNSCED